MTNPSVHFWSLRFITCTHFRRLPILSLLSVSSCLIFEMLLETHLLRSPGVHHLLYFLLKGMCTFWLHILHFSLMKPPPKLFPWGTCQRYRSYLWTQIISTDIQQGLEEPPKSLDNPLKDSRKLELDLFRHSDALQQQQHVPFGTQIPPGPDSQQPASYRTLYQGCQSSECAQRYVKTPKTCRRLSHYCRKTQAEEKRYRLDFQKLAGILQHRQALCKHPLVM